MFFRIFDAIGKKFGDEKPPSDLGDPLEFESGPFLDYAISWVYVSLKRSILSLMLAVTNFFPVIQKTANPQRLQNESR